MIVVVGDLLADVVVRHHGPLAHGSDTAARTVLVPGGAGGNVAAWLRRAGAEVRMAGCVGDDALASVAAAGIDGPAVRRVPGVATGTCVVLVDDAAERTMLPDAGANACLTAADVPALAPGDVLYVSGYTLLREATRPAALHALAAAREAGARTVLDPASAAPLAAAPGVVAAAGPVDLLLPNAGEAAVLGPEGLAAGREVVVTDGPRGATWSRGAQTVRAPAAATTVVDTTGAGDAFAAGFVAAWAAGEPPAVALSRGAALAAEAVSAVGARPADP